MHHSHPSSRRSWRSRGLSLVLALALMLGLVPGLDLGGGGAAHWADSYLSQLVEWGFIRPDQAQQPAQELTRADFMAITNRAYGYSENGPTPFEDIKETDWFYDDVGIAYTAQYIKGTSETTASPNDTLTRETAATILGRNMMLRESEGEILDFTDARDISFWSKGVIKSSLEHYLVGGYDDGTFRPQNSVTWGEMAAMLSRIVGTPLQEAGDYSLGGVFGNVTISSPGVTLRDTVISGDLYVTGGVGLGGIVLENVTVLGRIICSGTGEAEGGESSVLLRNVTADELLIDSLQGKTVSVQADGITEIGKTQVRTDAYIQDNTPEGMGLHSISLDGHLPEEGERVDPLNLTVSGRIEEVYNITPESTIHVAKGTLAKLNIDEAAEGSSVIIDRGAEIKEVNLDVGTHISGEGDIKHLNVNAPGSVVEILPEEIIIRPGITAEIDGEEMDTTDAEQSNREPQILSGYPVASDIAPNSITAIFATNKKGTVYWAVSAVTDGSVATEDVIKAPAYGGIAIKRGTVASPGADTEIRAAIAGLTPGGSYYLTAVMLDERGVQSPTKVIAFETPDNSIPAFAQGYPYFSLIENTRAQIAVMPTKDCLLYYAVLPSGASAPSEDELKTNSVSGTLGYGVRPVTKNIADLFWVNDLPLEEQVTYDLYLWLVDANGANKSAIRKMTFTTVDKTPPEFIIDPNPSKIQERSVNLTFRLNENGTVYWAIVPAGDEFLVPNRGAGQTTVDWSGEYAKLQVTSGLNAQSFNNVRATANRDGTITVSGLEAEKAYDFYYVAVDTAGNYSRTVKMITINSLDNNGPKFTQTFTKYSGLDNTTNPMVDTGVVLHVSENIRADVEGAGEDLLSLYQASVDRNTNEAARTEAKNKLMLSLKNTIVLNQISTATGRGSQPVPVKGSTNVGDNWVIDYEKVAIRMDDDNKLEITFPSDALQLDSGSTYYFTVTNITDTSTAENRVVPSTIDFYTNSAAGAAAGHDLRLFTTMLGQLFLDQYGLATNREDSERPVKPGSWTTNADGTVVDNKNNPTYADDENLIRVDYSFRMIPQSTSKMDNTTCYDLLFYTDSVISFDLYYRVVREENGRTTPLDLTASENSGYQMPNWSTRAKNAGTAGWWKLGDSSGILRGSKDAPQGVTLNGQFNGCDQSNYPILNKLNDDGNIYYEFGISLTQKDTSTTYEEWSDSVTIDVYAGAGPSTNLSSLSARPTFPMWDDGTESTPATDQSFLGKGLANGGGVSIGITRTGTSFLHMPKSLYDKQVPSFDTDSGYPKIVPGDTYAELSIVLDRAGIIDYVVAPRVGGINPTVVNNTVTPSVNFTNETLWNAVPLNGEQFQPGVPAAGNTPKTPATIPSPQALSVSQHLFPQYPNGRLEYTGNNDTIVETITGLQPETDYYVYLVTSGVSTDLSSIFMYKFTTKRIAKPKINLNPQDSGDVEMSTDVATNGYYRILSEPDARKIEFLSVPFHTYSEYQVSDASGHQLPNVYNDNSFTVLDALTTRYAYSEASVPSSNRADAYYPGDASNREEFEGGFTVFDIYANERGRMKIDTLIRTGQPGLGETLPPDLNWGPFGTTTTKENWTNNVLSLSSSLNTASNYVLLTLAQNKNADKGTDYEKDSFSAVIYRKMNLSPPNVINVTVISALTPGSAIGTYSGEFQFLFNNDVYITTGSSFERLPEVTDSVLLNPLYVTKPSGSSITVTNKAYDSFTLRFENVPAGQAINFGSGLFCSANGGPATEPLTITIGSNATKVFVNVTWGPDRDGKDKATWDNLGPCDINTAGNFVVSFANPNVGTWSGTSAGGYSLTVNGSQTNSFTINATVEGNPAGIIAQWTPDAASGNTVATVTPGAVNGNTFSGTVNVVGIGDVQIIVNVTVGAGETVSQKINLRVEGTVQFLDDTVPITSPLKMTVGDPQKIIRCRADGNLKIPSTITWASSQPSVAQVNANGFLSAVSPGEAIITAKAGNMTLGTFTVEVSPQRNTNLSIGGTNPFSSR